MAINKNNIAQVLQEARNICGESDGTPAYTWKMEETISRLAANDRVAIWAIAFFNQQEFQQCQLTHSQTN